MFAHNLPQDVIHAAAEEAQVHRQLDCGVTDAAGLSGVQDWPEGPHRISKVSSSCIQGLSGCINLGPLTLQQGGCIVGLAAVLRSVFARGGQMGGGAIASTAQTEAASSAVQGLQHCAESRWGSANLPDIHGAAVARPKAVNQQLAAFQQQATCCRARGPCGEAPTCVAVCVAISTAFMCQPSSHISCLEAVW